ncbi:DUF1631 family protein [Aliikangiella maris]|uniref:DUF1631 family protein n=2 Tax=Aliikangiella maris TaxID=3162458 RepID=A0ABV3MKA1_9GAMM
MTKDSVSSNDEVILKTDKQTIQAQLIEKYLVNQSQDSSDEQDVALFTEELRHLISQQIVQQQSPQSPDDTSSLENSDDLITDLNDTSTFHIKLQKYLQQRFTKKSFEISASRQNLIELVDNLFEFALKEKSIKPNIREIILQIKPIYLLLLLQSPEAITLTAHPAKSLLDDVAKVGLLWDESSPNAALILQQLQNVLDQLQQAALSDRSLEMTFASNAQLIKAFADNLAKRAEIFEKRIREAEEGKAKAELANLQSQSALNKLTCKKNIPEFILQMLLNAWQHIIFLDILKAEKNDSRDALFIAKALIVSIQSISDIEEFSKFIELQEVLLKWLRNKLEKTSYSFTEIDAFFAALDKRHSELISQIKLKLEQGPKEEILRLKPTTPFNETADATITQSGTTLTNDDIAIDEMTVEQWVEYRFQLIPEEAIQPADTLSPKSRQQKDLEASIKRIQLLKPGDWLVIEQPEKRIRCKLASYIDSADKYILVNGSGNKITEFTTEDLALAYKNKTIKIVGNKPLFEQAYESIFGNLLQRFKEEDAAQKKLAHLKAQESKRQAEKLAAQQAAAAQLQSQQQGNIQQADAQQVTKPTSNHQVTSAKITTTQSRNIQPENVKQENQLSTTEAQSKNVKTTIQSNIQKSALDNANRSNANLIKTPIPSKELTEQQIDNITKLAVGSWVEIFIKDKFKKCRLAAKISASDKFIFTDRSGIKIKECNTEELKSIYRLGELKLDEQNDLFDQALASVISNLRNLKADN